MESTHQEMIDYNRYVQLQNELRPIAQELQRLSQITTTEKHILRDLAAIRLPLENQIEDLASKYGSRHAIESLLEKVRRREARLAREAEETERAEETLRIEREIRDAPARTRALAIESRTTLNTLLGLITQIQREVETIRGDVPAEIRERLARILAIRERAQTAVVNTEAQIVLSTEASSALEAVRVASSSLGIVNTELANTRTNIDYINYLKKLHLDSIAEPHVKQLSVLRENWIRANENYLAAFPSRTSWYLSYVRSYTHEQRTADETLKAAEKEYISYYNTNVTSLRPRDIEIYKIQTIKDEIAKITSARDLATVARETEARRKIVEEEISKVNANNQPRIDTLNGEIKALESQIAPLETRIVEINTAVLALGVSPSHEKTKLNGEKRTRETELKRIRENIETKRSQISSIESEIKTQIASIRTRAGLAGGSKYGDDDENDEDNEDNEEYWKQKYLKYKAKYLKLKTKL